MIEFERYPHINEILAFYLEKSPEPKISRLIENGVTNEEEAEEFSKFIWRVVDNIHDDAESGNVVLGRIDNTDLLPDLSYEITKYMRKIGFYGIWERVSDNEN
ncbi:MAG: hypothetical protein B0W54_06830 [Cellvibrio sp. 79]|nr:MAG: hypothetical protein B0W54_06830 [Cellvibrio sp. 79]